MNGIFGEMPMRDYHATPALNSSRMRTGADISFEDAEHDSTMLNEETVEQFN